MRAARYTDFGGDISVVDLAEPDVPADGVMIRVEATGVCRSDWHAWRGHDSDVTLPHVPGHEFAGTVAAVGHEVRDVAVGARLAVPFVLGCGVCATCRRGDPQLCPDQLQPGFHLDGSFAEYVAVPRAEFNTVPIPDGVTMGAAAALGCRYTTAWRALVQQAGIRPGDRLVVFGCGGVGLAAIQIATMRHAEVIAVDPSETARERALAAGAAEAVDGVRLESAQADVTLDAIGHVSIPQAALTALRPGGTHLQVGIFGEPSPEVPLDLVMRNELRIVGSHGLAGSALPALLEHVAAGRLDPEGLFTRRVTLAEGAEHLQGMEESAGDVVLIDRMTP